MLSSLSMQTHADPSAAASSAPPDRVRNFEFTYPAEIPIATTAKKFEAWILDLQNRAGEREPGRDGRESASTGANRLRVCDIDNEVRQERSGWGRGDALYAGEVRRGNCTDFQVG